MSEFCVALASFPGLGFISIAEPLKDMPPLLVANYEPTLQLLLQQIRLTVPRASHPARHATRGPRSIITTSVFHILQLASSI